MVDSFHRDPLGQRRGQIGAQPKRIRWRAGNFCAGMRPAVTGRSETDKVKPSVGDDAERPDRLLTSTSERRQKCPLCTQAGGRRGIVQHRQSPRQIGPIRTALDRERALTWRRNAHCDIQRRHPVGRQAKARQTRGGEHERVDALTTGELVEARSDVATDLDTRHIGTGDANLCSAPGTAGADVRAWAEPIEPTGRADQHVAWVLALGHRKDPQPRWKLAWEVFGRMHRQIGPPVEQRLFEFLDE